MTPDEHVLLSSDLITPGTSYSSASSAPRFIKGARNHFSIDTGSQSGSVASSVTGSGSIYQHYQSATPRPAASKRLVISRRFSFPQNDFDLRWSTFAPALLSCTEIPKRTPFLQMLVRRGIPHNLRVQLWPILCGSKFTKMKYPDEYENILKENEGRDTIFTRQIETDLHRTFPDRLIYSTEIFGENGRSMQSLRRVLHAYGFRNPVVGYCQGMNFLAAFLLSVFEEEDAFWMLVTVIDRLLPADYYDSNLKGIKAEADLFEIIVAKELPNLNRHLRLNNIDMPMFTLDWFVSLYTVGFKPKMTLRIWDLFLYEGRVSLFCIALSLVRLHESKLLQIHTMDRLYDALKSLPSYNYNADSIIKGVNIPAMSAMVKRLSFSIVQSQSLSDTIQSARQQAMQQQFQAQQSTKKQATENGRPVLRRSPGTSPGTSRSSSIASSYKSFRSSMSANGLSSLVDSDNESESNQYERRSTGSTPTSSKSSTPSIWQFFSRFSMTTNEGTLTAPLPSSSSSSIQPVSDRYRSSSSAHYGTVRRSAGRTTPAADDSLNDRRVSSSKYFG